EPFFRLLLFVDVGCGRVPANHLSLVVLQWIVLNELPAILPVLEHGSHFQLERNSSQQSHPTFFSDPVCIVRVKYSREETLIVHLAKGGPSTLESHPTRI